MFYSLQGKIILTEPQDAHYHLAIEVGDIGYSLKTTHNTIAKLQKNNDKVKVYTYLYVREDALELFGFADLEELNCFKMLISISGVGPKAALSILSDVTPQDFAMCIATGDSKKLTRSKGIGAKTAQRIVLELKDKITNEQTQAVSSGSENNIALSNSNTAEAISALVVLGYPHAQAANAVSKCDSELCVEDIIKTALRYLAGNK